MLLQNKGLSVSFLNRSAGSSVKDAGRSHHLQNTRQRTDAQRGQVAFLNLHSHFGAESSWPHLGHLPAAWLVELRHFSLQHTRLQAWE